MEIPALKVTPRQQVGKETSSKLRRQGRVPGVCYGRNLQPLIFSLDPDDLVSILHGPLGLNSLIRLEGAEDRTVFVQEIQRHPVNRNILHVDFVHVASDHPIRRKVRVELTGRPQGVKVGGVLQVTRREILVECLPTNLPERVVVDVEPLHIGQSIHIEEIQLPQGVKALYDNNYSICAVVAPTEEKAPEEEVAEAAPAEGEAPPAEKPGAERAAGEKEATADRKGDKKSESSGGEKK